MKLSENIKMGKVVLNVQNMDNMKKFYSAILGMPILSESEEEVAFGAMGSDEVLLVLRQAAEGAARKKAAGMYHFALLVPERGDLGTILRHIIQVQYPLIGASDHGYSEAIYLNDPEGNGIEIYWDKPVSEWDIRDNGEIAGITIQMDAEGVLGASRETYTGMPEGTYMGHIHLFVADLQKSDHFYKDVLGMDLKYNFGAQAKFFAAGLYHHHIGTNTWGGSDLAAPQSGDLGMEYYTILVEDAAELDRIEERFAQSGDVTFERFSADKIAAKDPNGIALHIEVA